MEDNKIILINVRGNMIPMTKEQFNEFKNDTDWLRDMFDCRD